jgi:signal transduction histidine kinase
VRRAYTKAVHAVALVCLLIAMFAVVAVQAEYHDRVLWPALIAYGVMLASLWALDRNRSGFYAGAYLVIGAACIYWISIVAMTQFPGRAMSDTFVLSMAKVALVMVGGVGVRMLTAIAWSAGGLVVAGAATSIATRQTGSTFVLDATPICAFVLIVLLQVGLSLSRTRSRVAQPSLHRAERDEHLSAMRYRIELKAAAVMHDTVLNHLAAIANARDGELDPALRDQIDRDLEVLVGEEWLLDTEGAADQHTHVEWRSSRLFRAVEEARELGLSVEVSGDVAAVSRFTPERSVAVALAIKQCLVNVLKHADTDSAELVVYGTDDDVSLMVIDTGKGFSETDLGPDRLGLRQSVRRRIENVGGSVQVWSTPGKGTSVMIRVPASATAAAQ